MRRFGGTSAAVRNRAIMDKQQEADDHLAKRGWLIVL